MVSTDKFAATVIILLLLSILFSGCAWEKKTAQAPMNRKGRGFQEFLDRLWIG